MKITKIDGISHYKKQEQGILKKKQKEMSKDKIEIGEKVKKRFETQIESRIYKEFIKLKKGRIEDLVKGKNKILILEHIKSTYENDLKIELLEEIKNTIKNELKENFGIEEENTQFDKYIIKKEDSIKILENDIKNLKSAKSLYFLIKELYLEKENNNNWKLDEINLEEIFKSEDIVLGYKFRKNSEDKYVYLYKKDSQESKSIYELLNEFFEKKLGSNREKIRKSEEYKKIKKEFENYKNRKINFLVKSLENNKVNIKYNNGNLADSNNEKEKAIIEFFKKMVEEKDKEILENELESLIIDDFVNEVENIFKAVSEDEENFIGKIKGKILSELRKFLKDNKKTDEIDKIYYLELKKYVENNLSLNKKKNKERSKNKEEKEKLYYQFIKKVFCINDQNEMDKDKFKKRVDERFINLLTTHIIDYGKILYYKSEYEESPIDEYIYNSSKIETKELEYIKTKETLIRKMATLVSFATNSFYNLFENIKSDILLGKIEDENNGIIIKYKNNTGTEVKSSFKEKILNYFFDAQNITNKKDFLKGIKASIYNVRNGVNHFDKMYLGKYDDTLLSNSDEIKNYFKEKKNNINQYILDRFIPNNLEYYYEKEEIEKYFGEYEFKILKIKVPFAPNFKRIVKKGEDLSNSYFKSNFHNENRDEIKEFIKTRNFLLKELYYNNFYSEFLNNKENFKSIVEKVKKNKENRKGKSYRIINNYDDTMEISDYISLIHKLEMERIENNEKNRKDTSKYIRSFIEEIFLEGFIDYLNENKMFFLKEEMKLDKNRERVSEKLEISIKGAEELEEDSSEELNLYLFFSMIDSKRLSEFRNEMIKYKQFLEKRQELEYKFLGINIRKIELIIEFVILIREKLEISKKEIEEQKTEKMNALFNKFYNDKNEYNDILNKFIEVEVLEDKKNIPFYSSDGETPIVHSNLEKMRKYGTEIFLSKVQKNYKYSQKNYKYSQKEKNEKDVIKIVEIQNKKREIHEKWINIEKNKNKKTYNEEYNKLKEKYLSNENKIKRYNYLEHKEKLQNVYLLHEITSDLMARNVAFINKWERDFKFLAMSLKEYLINEEDKKKIREFLDPRLDQDSNEENFNVKNYRNKLRSITGLHNSLVSLIFFKNLNEWDNKKINNWLDFRNYISHFNHINSEEIKENFINQMNSLILLFSYDKKVQNHITKSMKTILEKYNMNIEFEILDDTGEKFEYKIKSIKSKKGKMLGKDNKFELLEEEFLDNVKELLEFED